MPTTPHWLPWLFEALHLLFVVVIAFRVIMRRPATGVALAWLFLVAAVPFLGAGIYLLLGERRIGLTRARRIAALRDDYRLIGDEAAARGLVDVDWSEHGSVAMAMDRLGRSTVGIPTVRGCSGELFDHPDRILRALINDIDTADRSLLMEFYIWHPGGLADEVVQAVVRAAQRGVDCRILVDAVGGAAWWRSKHPQQMRAAGARVQPALPVGFLRSIGIRKDLRLHRKIVVVDGKIAWTGSMNLVDPKYFKQDSGVGEWVDAMVRIEGAGVLPLALVMIGDWVVETGEDLTTVANQVGLEVGSSDGPVEIQVIPSGPGETDDCLLQMLLALINAAERELVLTTPYFVPDESLLRALRGAAGRGVSVHLIVPRKVDSLMARFASRSYYDDLLDRGVHIHLFDAGLLHTKSITADSRLSMFGTANLDMRSLWLNYEVCLFAYGTDVGKSIRRLQQSYMDQSQELDHETWNQRPLTARVVENSFRLVSPLL